MDPAFSVIFFTTCSGAGYGMLVLMGLLGIGNSLPPDRWFGIVGFGVAFALVVIGLLASVGHLGHPERGWRAMTQWRSSWLAREGVMAVVTFVPATLYAYGWIMEGNVDGFFAVMGVLTAVCSWLTVACTAMIYRCLRPIHTWHNDWTVPAYVLLSLMSGTVLLSPVAHIFGIENWVVKVFPLILMPIGWALKTWYWSFNQTSRSPSSINTATQLFGGTVRQLDPPHTESNYLQHEMGYPLDPETGRKVRLAAHILGFALPIAMFTVVAFSTDPILTIGGSLVAWASCSLGILGERWLFFAEARHAVTMYYGAQRA